MVASRRGKKREARRDRGLRGTNYHVYNSYKGGYMYRTWNIANTL